MLDLLGGRIEFIGTIVGTVYAVGAAMQLVGGFLADRFSLKTTYVALWIFQTPLLLMVAEFNGLPLALTAAALTMAGTAILPTENLMLSKFAPPKHQGVTFGVKFVVSLGSAPLGIFLIVQVREATGEFTPLLLAMSGFSVLAVLASAILPRIPENFMPGIAGSRTAALD